jgi:hypothetical protein
MLNIIAICPYCRRGGVRAQTKAIGSIAHCPKCKSNFTILPEDNLPDWAAKAKPEAESFYQSSSPLAETRATAKRPDRTEPSPIVRADPKLKKKAKAKEEPKEPEQPPTPTQTPEATPEVAPTLVGAVAPQVTPESHSEETLRRLPTDTGMVFALLALILVGPTILVSQVPYGRAIGIVLAVVGVLGGLLSLGAEGRARLTGIAAAGLHVLLLAIFLFFPSLLGLDSWGGAKTDEVVEQSFVVDRKTGLPAKGTPLGWIEAGKESWQTNEMQVAVVSATVGPVELRNATGEKKTTKERYLQVSVRVVNLAAPREVPLTGWAAGGNLDGVRATDSNGKPLPPAAFDAGWTPDRGRPATKLSPAHSSEVKFVFAALPPKTDYVRLELPGSAIGHTGDIRFRLGAGSLAYPVR